MTFLQEELPTFAIQVQRSVFPYGHCLPGSKSYGNWICPTTPFCQLGMVPVVI
jgi:hypothetical protein